MSFTTGTKEYGRHVGRYGAGLAAAFCDAAGVHDGDRALDVGCGPGALIGELASRLGTDSVAGIDPSAPFIEACRAAVPGVDVRQAGAEELPFADSSFDLVLSQLVVNFIPDAPRGVTEMRRVARRSVAACVWDYAGEMTMLRAFWDAALEVDPGAPDEAAMRYCTQRELADLWEQASLRGVTTGELLVHADYKDFDDYWSPFLSGLGPTGAYCVSLDDDTRSAFREACHRRLGSPDGSFRLGARAWFVRGEV